MNVLVLVFLLDPSFPQLVLTIPIMSLREKYYVAIVNLVLQYGLYYAKLFISLLKNVTAG